MEQRFVWLAAHPHAGCARDEVREGYRGHPHGKHVVFYMIIGADSAVIGVPHGAMDVEA